jgi:hypothetical protein
MPPLQTFINEAIGLALVALFIVLLYVWRSRRGSPPDDEE